MRGAGSRDYVGERVPTLEEVLSLHDVELELMGYGTDFLEGVVGAVRAADALDRVAGRQSARC